MFQEELEELTNLANIANALVRVTLDSCTAEDYTTQQLVLEEAHKYTEELNNRLIELNFTN